MWPHLAQLQPPLSRWSRRGRHPEARMRASRVHRRRTARPSPKRDGLRQFCPTGDGRHDLFLSCDIEIENAIVPTQTEHHGPIGYGEDIRQIVADQHDPETSFAKSGHQFEDVMRLLDTQSRRRLV
jgi:hypothetical protein